MVHQVGFYYTALNVCDSHFSFNLAPTCAWILTIFRTYFLHSFQLLHIHASQPQHVFFDKRMICHEDVCVRIPCINNGFLLTYEWLRRVANYTLKISNYSFISSVRWVELKGRVTVIRPLDWHLCGRMVLDYLKVLCQNICGGSEVHLRTLRLRTQ